LEQAGEPFAVAAVEVVRAEKERAGRRAEDHEEEADDQAGVAVERFSSDTGAGAARELLLLAALCLSWGFYLHDQVVGSSYRWGKCWEENEAEA
jgi:uncharacterized protein HemX